MRNQAELTHWILKNVGKLALSIEHLGWIDNFFPCLTDVAVHFEFGGRRWSGWGFGESEDEALTKAMAEAIERVVMQESGLKTSNGLAAHRTFELAAQSAANELRERDLLLCHFLTGIPLMEQPIEKIENLDLERVRRWFRDQGVAFRLFALGRSGYLGLIDGRKAARPFGFVIGAGVKKDSWTSAISACVEACRAGYWQLALGPKIMPLSLEDFRRIEAPKFSDHGRLAINLDYASRISWMFNGDGMVIDNEDIPIQLERVEIVAEELQDCPLTFAKATSAHLQDLFLGEPKPEAVNLIRLARFAGRDISWGDVNRLPHPLD